MRAARRKKIEPSMESECVEHSMAQGKFAELEESAAEIGGQPQADNVDASAMDVLTLASAINSKAKFLLRQTRGRFLVEFDLLNKKGSQLVVNLLRAQRMLKKPSA